MKVLLRILGGFLIIISIIFLLYSAVKLADSTTEIQELDLGDGIVMVDETSEGEESKEFGQYGFIIASVCGVGGIFFLILARGR